MVTKKSIEEAHERIRSFIHLTPVLISETINKMAGAELFFKCENLQYIGAFKARGALNAALSLSRDELMRGIATHSSGNHAQAVARAANMLGTKAYIVMPNTSPEIKKRGVAEYGGKIFECEPTQESRENTLKEVIQSTGATEIHPFNSYEVIAGQATVVKEFFEQVNDLDVVVVPVGGGGLLSGTALAAKYFSPATAVIAGEPEGADDAFRAMQSGQRERSQGNSIADGLLTSLGDKTFPIISQHVKEVITVSDSEIVSSMRLVWERLKIIIEPSAAVPLAAVVKAPQKFENKKVGIIFSGGNVDLDRASALFAGHYR